MKTFFAENKTVIGKLFRTHIVMAIFGIMVYIPFNTDSTTMKWIMFAGSVIAILLYLFLLDVDLWYLGAEDRIKVDSGRKKRSPLKGLLVGLIPQIPSVVLGILYAVISVIQNYYQAYPSGSTWSVIRVILWGITMLWNGIYNGVQTFFLGTTTIALFHLLIPLLPILCSYLFYELGYHGSHFLKPPARNQKQNND